MSNTECSLVTPLFLPLAVALKFDIYILPSKEADKLFCNFHCFQFAAAHQGCCQRTFLSSSQADKPGRILFQVFESSCAFALGGLTHLEPGNQLTKILIPNARGTQQRQ